MKISLIIPGKPAGKGRPRITKNGVYTPSKTRKFESLIQTVWYQSKAKAASRVNPDEDNFQYLFGTVVYINQKHHWFTAEFETIMGQTFRESFDFQD